MLTEFFYPLDIIKTRNVSQKKKKQTRKLKTNSVLNKQMFYFTI